MGDLKNLDALLEGFINDDGPAGAGLRVYKGEECLYDRCIGFADAELKKPFRPDTICQMASMTKCIAVTAVMQLYEKGLFLLTDPVEEYIPEFANRQVYDIVRSEHRVRPAKSPVTIGNLFDMTSGITVAWGWPNPNSQDLTREMEKYIAEGKYTISEFAKVYGRTPGLFDPGEHYFYGDSHNVLAAILEKITGKKFSVYLKENIFDPLGIEDTFFKVPDDKKDRQSVLWSLNDDGTRSVGHLPFFFFDAPDFESACGGLYGTLEDYSRFARCMTLGEWNGVRLLNDHTIKLMATNRLTPQCLKDFYCPYLAGYGYGLGMRTKINPAEGGNASSVGEFGWTGGFGSWVLMDPVEKISIIYFHQSLPNREDYMHPRIRNIVYSAL